MIEPRFRVYWLILFERGYSSHVGTKFSLNQPILRHSLFNLTTPRSVLLILVHSHFSWNARKCWVIPWVHVTKWLVHVTKTPPSIFRPYFDSLCEFNISYLYIYTSIKSKSLYIRSWVQISCLRALFCLQRAWLFGKQQILKLCPPENLAWQV